MHHTSHDRGVSVQGSLSLSRGVSVQGASLSRRGGGLCPGGFCPGGSLSRGVSVRETTPYGKERAVRMPLE